MAEISKLSGVAIADVAAVDAVLKANIANILGLTLPSGAAFLLDTYTGAAAAYSTRRLASATTVLMRVRRDTAGGTGDDDEADVAYDTNNELSLDSAISNASAGVTATTLGQFLNVGTVNGTTYTNPDSLTVTASCFVNEWKDQAGSNDATQATHASQPQIHSGTANTDLIKENGKPALDFDGSNDFLRYDATNLSIVDGSFYNSTVFAFDAANIYGVWNNSYTQNINVRIVMFADGRSSSFLLFMDRTGVQSFLTYGTQQSTGQRMQTVDGVLSSGTQTTTGYHNGTQIDSFTYTEVSHDALNSLEFGRQFNTSYLNGRIQESIFYDTSQASNRTAIEENINSNYLIYQPTDTPTSGLLATYSGAAAAYSVRQLANTAVLAMRIRRDGDDEETNIGFDENGDLDTTAISDFCGSDNGYVVTWYDQSTNGSHATQGTAGRQPQIYNGTAVITENGKPAIEFTADCLANSHARTVTAYTAYVVGTYSASGGTTRILTNSPGADYNKFVALYALNNTTVNTYTDGNNVAAVTTSINTQLLLNFEHTGSVLTNYANGSAGTPYNDAAFSFSIPGDSLGNDSGQQFSGKAQELVIYDSDQSSNRTGIETDLNTYFSIYT